MGNKKVHAKGRRDKFYHLAKETGYRARSAFKLIQLNRKYDFLTGARVCIDLCAAPGGWMQVAQKFMPSGALIVGVDLVPIRPIPGTVGLVADITTDKCRAMLKKELKHFKANCVLHDGAPNVGQAWVQDAFTQVELVLKSLKLATEFLMENGTFVTKVFRSADYQSLIWVFNQLFRKVHATKPVSSRNVSAEIFVVCEEYIAPHKIDPRMLDPRFVFSEISADAKAIDVFNQSKKKPKALGYDDQTLYKRADAEAWCTDEEFMETLGTVNELVIAPDSILRRHPATTEEIFALLRDLKVLGKKDFKQLLRWRATMRTLLEAQRKAAAASGGGADGGKSSSEQEEEDEAAGEEDSSQGSSAEEEEAQREVDSALADVETQARAEAKRVKRRKQKLKRKLREKMALQADMPTDVGEITGDALLFDLKRIDSKGALEAVEDAAMQDLLDLDPLLDSAGGAGGALLDAAAAAEAEGSDMEGEGDYLAMLENQLDAQYESYLERKGALSKKIRFRKKLSQISATAQKRARDELSSDEEGEAGDALLGKEEATAEEGETGAAAALPARANSANPLIVQRKTAQMSASARARRWFAQDEFRDAGAGLEDELVVDEAAEDEAAAAAAAARKAADEKNKNSSAVDESSAQTPLTAKERRRLLDEEDREWAEKLGLNLDVDRSDASESEMDTESEEEAEEAAAAAADRAPVPTTKRADQGFEEVPASAPTKQALDAAGLAIATQMLSASRKREIIEQAYNRYAADDGTLPMWFADEEHRHKTIGPQVTKEMVAEARARQREINERPIKKVLEAKARKKKKQARSMAKLTQSVEAITENAALTEREKSNQINALYRKVGRSKSRERTTLVVAKRSSAGKRAVRPNGVTGRYLQVDKRMIRDKRMEKAAERRKKHKRKYK